MTDAIIGEDDPLRPDVRELLETHLAWSHEVTPAGHVHALDVDGLADPTVSFFSARLDGRLVGVGALRRLDADHAEIKSMHTCAAARGAGLGRAMVEHLLDAARTSGCRRVSLETGTQDAFAPARALYRAAGFVECPPFGSYTTNPHSVCMTQVLRER